MEDSSDKILEERTRTKKVKLLLFKFKLLQTLSEIEISNFGVARVKIDFALFVPSPVAFWSNLKLMSSKFSASLLMIREKFEYVDMNLR